MHEADIIRRNRQQNLLKGTTPIFLSCKLSTQSVDVMLKEDAVSLRFYTEDDRRKLDSWQWFAHPSHAGCCDHQLAIYSLLLVYIIDRTFFS